MKGLLLAVAAAAALAFWTFTARADFHDGAAASLSGAYHAAVVCQNSAQH